MAREDVNIKVSANVAEAIQLWKAMEAGPDGMAKALDAMGQKGQKSTKGLGDEVAGLVGKWATVGTAVAAVTKLISDQYEAVKKLREERNASTNSVDEVWNRFQVQAGIPNGQRADQVRTQLMQTIVNRKMGPIQGLQAAEQLGSAGASVQDIIGGGLDEFLQLVTASNAAGQQVDQASLAQAMVKFLAANGLKPNREGMRGTSLAIQQLFGGTNLQLSNLSRFAPEAGKIASFSHLAAEDQLAIYSQFLETMDESTAAVAFRGGVTRLATAGGVPERVAALKSLGLKPEDVDFKGEDFFTAMERLRKGFGGARPEQRNIAAQRIFGDEALGFYTTLLAPPGALEESRKRGEMARDPSGAAERLSIAESSRAAAARQADSLEASMLYDPSKLDPKVIRQRLQALTQLYAGSEGQQAWVMGHFDNPVGPDWLYSSDPNDIAARGAGLLSRSLNLRRGRIDQQAGRDLMIREQEQFILEQIRGTKPIRIVGPDGLDIPTEPAATGLGQ